MPGWRTILISRAWNSIRPGRAARSALQVRAIGQHTARCRLFPVRAVGAVGVIDPGRPCMPAGVLSM